MALLQLYEVSLEGRIDIGALASLFFPLFLCFFLLLTAEVVSGLSRMLAQAPTLALAETLALLTIELLTL